MPKKKENLKIDNNDDDLKNKLILLQESLRILRFKSQGSRSKNVKEEKNLKKQIARILTEINKNNKKL
ncbi:MAG: 50S ribosomal protein L29 [Patescibacteria group bacterium]